MICLHPDSDSKRIGDHEEGVRGINTLFYYAVSLVNNVYYISLMYIIIGCNFPKWNRVESERIGYDKF